jgi:UDP-glucose 4-epimerase
MEMLETIQGIRFYNLGSGKPVSVFELLNTFKEATGISISYVIGSRRPGDSAVSYADISRTTAELGWKAKKTLREMCMDSYKSALNIQQ